MKTFFFLNSKIYDLLNRLETGALVLKQTVTTDSPDLNFIIGKTDEMESTYQHLLGLLPKEFSTKTALLRHIRFTKYWTEQKTVENCSHDPGDMLQYDIPQLRQDLHEFFSAGRVLTFSIASDLADRAPLIYDRLQKLAGQLEIAEAPLEFQAIGYGCRDALEDLANMLPIDKRAVPSDVQTGKGFSKNTIESFLKQCILSEEEKCLLEAEAAHFRELIEYVSRVSHDRSSSKEEAGRCLAHTVLLASDLAAHWKRPQQAAVIRRQ